MIFSSYPYLVFLALSVLVFVFLERRFPAARRAFLLLTSLVFYAWWRADFVFLLFASTIVNYAIGGELTRRASTRLPTRAILTAGLVFNLAMIAVFKYAGLFVATTNAVFHTDFLIPALFLPLAISFFTFEQISYLVDASEGKAPPYGFLDYALFVSYFPHLIAGPIVRHNDLIPQFHAARNPEERGNDMAVGLTLFTIGLAKKALIADNLAPFANLAFAAAHQGAAISTTDAWLGTLFFTFQIYFDFSGYTDMALGSSLMFGIRLPFNFNSPYKAASIIDFWRRWHVSLSQFLRDYLYFRLGGNRHGRIRRYINLFITMLLGGLWHGANWTFVIWGGLHGAYLAINHAWRHMMAKHHVPPPLCIATHALSVLLTFAATSFAWVLFRAQTFDDARRMILGLIGKGGDSAFLSLDTTAIIALIALFGIVWFAPNSMEITWKLAPALEPPKGYAGVKPIQRLLWTPSRASAVMFAVLAAICVLSLSNLSPFIYFQF